MKKSFKLLLLLLWIGLMAGAIYYLRGLEFAPSEYPALIRSGLESFGVWGPVIYMVLYVLRPLILFPATVLTIVAGLAFGPVWGTVYVMVAANISAAVGFFLGRFFGYKLMQESQNKFIQNINNRAEHNGFMTVLLMRLLYFPFDLTNIGCGVSKIRYWDFMWGSFIGMLSGSLTFVLLGGAANSALGVDGGEGLDPMTKTYITLGVSLGFFLFGLWLSKYFSKRNKDLVALKETTS